MLEFSIIFTFPLVYFFSVQLFSLGVAFPLKKKTHKHLSVVYIKDGDFCFVLKEIRHLCPVYSLSFRFSDDVKL